MSIYTIEEARSLSFAPNIRLRELAFDGCHYYFTLCGSCQILKTDQDFAPVCFYDTVRAYDCICYDTRARCFWVSARCCTQQIFKLDCQMREVDTISLLGCAEARGAITGLSYACCDDSLLVAYPATVLECNKCTGACTVRHRESGGMLTAVLALSPGFLVISLRGGVQTVSSITPCGDVGGSFCVDADFSIANMVYRPERGCESRIHIVSLAMKKGCYPHLCDSYLTEQEMGFVPCRCNLQLCGTHCCEDTQRNSTQACVDIIESIALMEASLAHILNAEGEKLQKVIAESDDIGQIMCVNREVNRTIMNATHLEHILYAKLSAVADCLPPNGEELCPCASRLPHTQPHT